MGISNFTVNVHHMDKLKYLDISGNNMRCLSKQAMKELTNLSSSQRTKFDKTILHINLSRNPIQCNCQCYTFLKWLKSTDIMFTYKGNLCSIFGKNYTLSSIRSLIESECFPHTWFHTMIKVQVSFLVLITVYTISRRHKYRLYFLYLQLRILVVSKLIAEDVKSFDAFISYAEQDREWIKKKLIKNLEQPRKLKLLVASRDFEAGRLISANIHSAITTSRKTVFVISKSFLNSSWCLEEFAMALTVSKHSILCDFVFGKK